MIIKQQIWWRTDACPCRIEAHQIQGSNVHWPDHAKFYVWDIRGQKFVLQKKWAKIHKNRLRPATQYKAPYHAKFHRDWWNHLAEKRYKNFFTSFNILAAQGYPQGQMSPVWMVGYTNPPLAICKILSRSDDPSPRYLLPNLVDFVAGLIHKRRDQQTYSKRCLCIICGDNNCSLSIVVTASHQKLQKS